MSEVSFEIPGEPRGKGRHRAQVVRGRIHTFTPDETARYENLVKLCARQAMRSRPPITGAVEVEIIAQFTVPPSWSKKRQRRALDGLECPTKFDVDNLAKAIFDGANGVLFVDDKQVAELRIVKGYGPMAFARVTMRERLGF